MMFRLGRAEAASSLVSGRPPDKARAMLGRRLSLSFDRASLSDVVAFLRSVTGLPFSTAKVGARRAVSLRARDLTLQQTLDVVCRLARVRVVKGSDGSLVFDE